MYHVCNNQIILPFIHHDMRNINIEPVRNRSSKEPQLQCKEFQGGVPHFGGFISNDTTIVHVKPTTQSTQCSIFSWSIKYDLSKLDVAGIDRYSVLKGLLK